VNGQRKSILQAAAGSGLIWPWIAALACSASLAFAQDPVTDPAPAPAPQTQGSGEPKPPLLPPDLTGAPPPVGTPAGQPPPGPATGADTPEVAPVPVAASEPAPPAEPASAPIFEPGYRPLGDMAALCAALVASAPGAARMLALPADNGAQALVGIEFGKPGPVPLETRPTLLLLGGLDGVSLSGGEAALAISARLLGDPERLPADVAFVVVPWASPAALSATFKTGPLPREPAVVAVDEDRDGRFDEDPPDDVDGDGLVLSMLIEDPAGAWTPSSDDRFLVAATPGDAPLYQRVPEGRDDDGDGRYNEDGPGGVVLDRNFPLGRENAWRDPLCGAVPLSDGTARALADLALARRTVAVLLLQGNHGGLAVPGGAPGPGGVELPLPADRRLLERAGDTFLTFTGRQVLGMRTLRQARGVEVSGAALDWFYAGAGAVALEVAPWGPFVDGGGDVVPRDARYGAQNGSSRPRDMSSRPPPSESDRAWGAWLDDTRGGLGFVDWHPVDLGAAQHALVGGWEPNTQANPPQECLARALLGLPEFVGSLAQSVPKLELRVLRAEREGDVVHVRARVKNLGALPTGLAGGAGPTEKGALTLAIELQPGARLLAGENPVRLGRLDGGELSREAEWIVFAPEGSTLTLRANCELALPVVVEVRP
jgi:hypothetical protein